MPVKSWRATTAEAVDSLLKQTLSTIEILLIGHDGVEELLRKLPRDPRIRGIAREGEGIVSALNTGLAAARAPFIARMDDDDVAYPERLEAQRQYLLNTSKVDICATRIRFIDESGSTDGVKAGNLRYADWLNILTQPADIANACFTECPMPHPTWMAHQSIWQSLNGYRKFDGPEDYDFILRAMTMGFGLGKPNAILQDWREHPERLTYSDTRYRREAFTRCSAWAAAQPSNKLGLQAERSVWICGTGKHARHWHDALEDLNITVAGFVDIRPSDATRQKRNKPVIDYYDLKTRRSQSLVITALPDPKARQQLKSYFDNQGWLEGQEYIFGN